MSNINAMIETNIMSNDLPIAHFMHDNHTFSQLHGMGVDEAMALVEQFENEQRGHGFVSAKGGTVNNRTVQWRPGKNLDWRRQVHDLLLAVSRERNGLRHHAQRQQ